MYIIYTRINYVNKYSKPKKAPPRRQKAKARLSGSGPGLVLRIYSFL